MQLSSLKPNDESFLRGVRDLNRRIERASLQISSGKRVHTAADDPDRAGLLLEARSALARSEQIGRNFDQIQGEADTAEIALQTALKAMDRASTLAAQGASSLASAQARGVLANEIQTVLDQMVALTQTSVQGRYVFAGDSDQSIPYTAPEAAYGGSPATRQALHPSGATFTIARTAEEIFGHADPARNVFGALTAIRDALRTDGDAVIQAALPGLRSASDHLNEQLAFYGTIQNRVREARDTARAESLRLKTQIASIEDADLLTAATDLTTATRDHAAALQGRARANRGSLFDYLG
jgi:flagellar hook-associated protein 3 FlgL